MTTRPNPSPASRRVGLLGIGTAALLCSAIPAAYATAQDANGPPLLLAPIPATTSVAVPQYIQNQIFLNLPESRAVGAEFLDPRYDPNLYISQPARVTLSFLGEGAGYRNSLGWFSYSESTFASLSKADVDRNGDGVVSLGDLTALSSVSAGMIFDNTSAAGSGGSLTVGTSVTLGGDSGFATGTRLGFFLVQDGFTGSGVAATGAGPNERQTFYSLDMLNPEAAAGATIDTAESSARHVAMMFGDGTQSSILLGFEDLNRVNARANRSGYRSDEDFNDTVFLLTSDPVEAIMQTPIYTAPPPAAGTFAAPLAMLAAFLWRRRRSAPWRTQS